MKVAIMQPYFFPYLGYFSLIKHTDQFILFDTVQYIRHGWIDRNRILKPGEGWQYIKVPVRKHSRDTLIKNIEINNDLEGTTRIRGQLQHYKKSAPYFRNVMMILDDVFSNGFNSIVDLDYSCLKAVNDYLGIHTPIEVFSRMNLTIKDAEEPDEWALNICKEMPGVTDYWNPPGGKDFFDREKYQSNSINLQFHEINLTSYSQRRKAFEAGLSIIDVLMFNDPSAVNGMLDDFKLS
jgi:hypothetical protein